MYYMLNFYIFIPVKLYTRDILQISSFVLLFFKLIIVPLKIFHFHLINPQVLIQKKRLYITWWTYYFDELNVLVKHWMSCVTNFSCPCYHVLSIHSDFVIQSVFLLFFTLISYLISFKTVNSIVSFLSFKVYTMGDRYHANH